MNYSSLQVYIAQWLNRSDLTAMIPTFIELAEASLSHKLRVLQMETQATLTLDAEYVDLPADWRETVQIELVTTSNRTRRIDLVNPAAVADSPSKTGDPVAFYHVGSQVRFYPVPESGTATITYFAALPTLSDAAPTNWALTAIPGAYLYGSLLQTAPYLVEDERLTTWGALYKSALDEFTAADRNARLAAGLRKMR